jgi:WD40 repeat protein
MRIVRIFPNGGVLSFALSPDGRYVMGGTKAIYHVAPSIWDVETGERVYQYSRPWGIGNVSYSPSGKYIVNYNLEGLILFLAQPVSGMMEGSERAGILYPNPSSGVVVVGGIEAGVPTQVELYDVHGRFQEVLYRGVPSEGEVMVTVGRGVRGMYVLRVVQGRVVRWYTVIVE